MSDSDTDDLVAYCRNPRPSDDDPHVVAAEGVALGLALVARHLEGLAEAVSRLADRDAG